MRSASVVGAHRDPLSELSADAEAALRGRLARWAAWFLGLPEAEFADAYQGAWSKLLEGRLKGRPVRNLEHALRWSIQNCWLEECRRRRRRPTVPLEECPPSSLRSQVASDPAEQVEQLEEARYLFMAARTVDGLSWQLVLLRDLWGLSPATVCERLGLAGRTYRRKHARALEAISRLAVALADRGCAERQHALHAMEVGMAADIRRQAVPRHMGHCASRCGTLAAPGRNGAAPDASTPEAGRALTAGTEVESPLSAAA